MARTNQEYLEKLLEQRDALQDQLHRATSYSLDGREVKRESVEKRLDWLVFKAIPQAEKAVNKRKGPARSLVQMRRAR